MADKNSFLVSDLTPEEQQDIQAQLANPGDVTSPVQTPHGADLVDTLTPEELADVSIQTKGKGFNPAQWLASNLKTASPEKVSKVADAKAYINERGFDWHDIDLIEAAKGVKEIVTGAADYSARALEVGPVSLVGRLVSPKLAPQAQVEFEKEQAKKSAELTAATESAQFGLADMIRKGGAKVSRWAGKAYQKLAVDPSLMPAFMKSPLDKTPKERQDDLWNEVSLLQQKENIARGHGAATEAVLGNVIADMEASGATVDPQAVEHMAAGEPITFAAFGQGFKVGTMGVKAGARTVLRPIATFTSKLPAVEAVAALRAAQKTLAKAGADATAAEKGAVTAGEEATRLGEVAQTGLDVEHRAAVASGVGGLASPTLRADLNAAATAANAARRAEMLGVTAQEGLDTATKAFGEAEATAAATPGVGLVQKLERVGKQAGVAKKAVIEAAKGTVERVSDIGLGFVPGAIGATARTAETVGKVVGGILPPLATPHYVKTLTGKMGALAETSFGATKQLMKGETRNYSPLVGAASSAVQAVPTIAAEAGKGFVVDVALAAVTSETPQDTASMPVFMTAFGAARGLGKGAAHGVQRQLIGERNFGADTGSANKPYNRFSALDAANKFAVDQAEDPNVVRRLSALRDFNKDTGAQLYWVPEGDMVKKILKRYNPGKDEAWYDDAAQQRAVYLGLKDDAGTPQKVIIVQDMDAAPHDSGHAAQDVVGERAMTGIDNIVYDEYAPVWDQVGMNYARRFFSAQKMADYAARGEGWQEAVLDLSLGTADWRDQLNPLQVIGMSNHYVAREVSAEGFDALFKHSGPELLQNDSLPGKLARILGHILTGMGIEPFQDFRTEGQGLPLTFKTAEDLRTRFKEGMDAARVEAARPDVENVPAYGTAKKGKISISPRGSPEPAPAPTPETPALPATPKETADRAREIIPSVPTTPAVRGGKAPSEILAQIADAIENRTGVVLDYMSAPGEPASAITSQRPARRAIIEMFRTMPKSARTLFEKKFMPERVVQAGNKVQVIGWSPEVFAANAHKLAAALNAKDARGLSRYPIDKKTGSFTEQGWHDLFIAATNFSRNQQQGLTGAGEPLVVPGDLGLKGFFKPVPSGEAGFPLDQRQADMISALFGIPVPKTPRIGKVYPRNLAGQEISEATKPGRVSVPVQPREPFSGPKAEAMGIEGRTLNEVNPFRADLAAKGIEPDFIEVLQRLNLENIADISEAPKTATEIRGKEFTLQAGFQPKLEDVPADKRGEGKEVTVRRPDGSTYQAMDKGPAEGFENGEIVTRRAIGIPVAGKDGVVKMNHGLMPKDHTIVTDEGGAAFQPGTKGYVGDLEGGEIKAVWADLSSKTHLGAGMNVGDGNWRYNPDTKTVYWWKKPTHEIELDTVKAWLEQKGHEVKNHVQIDAPASGKKPGGPFDQAHGLDKPPDRQFAEQKATVVPQGLIDETKARFSSSRALTKSGKDLEEKGFEFSYNFSPEDQTAHLRLFHPSQPDTVIGEIKYSLDPKGAVANVEEVRVEPEYRRRGMGEALYREMATRLQESRITELSGEVLAPEPLEIRQKLFGDRLPGKRDPHLNIVRHPIDPNMQFSPKKGKEDPLKFIPTSHASPSKAWILPDGKPVQLGAQWHHHWLDENKAVQKKYGLDVPAFEGNDSEGVREAALKKGFARVNYEPASGRVTVEARQKDWRRVKGTVQDMAEKNLDDVEKMSIHVLNEDASKIVDSAQDDYLFRLGDQEKESAIADMIDSIKFQPKGWDEMYGNKGYPATEYWAGKNGLIAAPDGHSAWVYKTFPKETQDLSIGKQGGPYRVAEAAGYLRVLQENNAIHVTPGVYSKWEDVPKAARKEIEDLAFAKNSPVLFGKKVVIEQPRPDESAQFSPKRAEQEMLPGVGARRAPLSTVERASMTRQEVRDHYPEAVVPRANDESLPSEITKSPLYKQAGTEDAAVSAFADRLVSFAKEYKNDPMFEAGAKWYSDFVPQLKKEFGDDAPIMAEFLSATSPQTNVEANFGYALDAMESLKAGRFDKIISKLSEGLAKLEDGSWESWLKRNAGEGTSTPAAFLAAWINKYNLKPTQSNGKLYGQHSLAVLKVLTRRWVDENAGPKTANFVRNLTGDSKEATIDLWADRTMRWAGYEGFAPRWRILAENKHAVSDEDFAFSQKAFRAAAEKLDMEPSALQGALWFAEKQRWADNGWGYLSHGSFQDEMKKLPMLRAGVKQRLDATKKAAKAKTLEQNTLDIQPRFK